MVLPRGRERRRPEETTKTQDVTRHEESDDDIRDVSDRDVSPLPKEEEVQVVNEDGEACKTCVHCSKK